MIRQPVTSSNLKSVGYDAGTQTLEVEFANGTVYEYAKVPPETYAAMQKAKSIGSFFGYAIRGKFEGKKVEQDEKVQA